MQPQSQHFSENAGKALQNPELQSALGNIKKGWQVTRAQAARDLPEFEALRDRARDIKNDALAHLDLYLETFERNANRAGTQVHWARDAEEACEIVHHLCERYQAKKVTKSKSMVTEEIGLNTYLKDRGVEPVETDLGEYILQLAEEAPSHLVAPAVHKSKDEISDLFLKHHGGKRLEKPEELVGAARQVMRDHYLSADIGINGANFLVAETGSAITVTNEGNAELTQGLPNTQIIVTGIEKVVPRLADAMALLRVLARSATGQEFSTYTTIMTGPKREQDLDGPENAHIVLVDNGRSQMIGTSKQDMLRCIRCGACMNHCPVYLATGGHAYGWVYPGPMGAVLTPQFIGIEKGYQLPNASTFCGKCEEVCPVRIPLPKLMRYWREEQFERKLLTRQARWSLKAWAFITSKPRLYRKVVDLSSFALSLLGGRNKKISRLPLAAGWTNTRDMPAPENRTSFMSQYRKRPQGKAGRSATFRHAHSQKKEAAE